MLLNNYPREEVETRHVPPCYNKKHISSLTSTQLLFFDKVHVKQVSGPPTKSQVNDYKVLFPRDEEGKVDVERGVYGMKNQPKRENFKY